MRIEINEAIELLHDGEVVAIPTDTVYGLACDARNRRAVQKIFEIKKRPNDRPMITLIYSTSQLHPFVDKFPEHFDDLTRNFWPGALTLVLPIKTETVLDEIRRGLSTAGFRIPGNRLTLNLLKQFGPIVASSANLSGSPSALNADEVEKYFGKDFPVLDGGQTKEGIESTILSFENGSWKVLREGAISSFQIEEVLK